MPNEILFPQLDPTWMDGEAALRFFAVAADTVVHCSISGDVLMSLFGASDLSEAEMLRAFAAFRPEIEAMARKRLQAKSTWRHGERIDIRATDFPDDPAFPQSTESLRTTVAPALEADATLGRSIRAANLWLRERMVRGENRYTAAWDIVVLPGTKSLVRLTLGDEMTEASAQGLFTRADIADEPDLQNSLKSLQDDLWSRKMRVLSERLVLSEAGD